MVPGFTYMSELEIEGHDLALLVALLAAEGYERCGGNSIDISYYLDELLEAYHHDSQTYGLMREPDNPRTHEESWQQALKEAEWAMPCVVQ